MLLTGVSRTFPISFCRCELLASSHSSHLQKRRGRIPATCGFAHVASGGRVDVSRWGSAEFPKPRDRASNAKRSRPRLGTTGIIRSERGAAIDWRTNRCGAFPVVKGILARGSPARPLSRGRRWSRGCRVLRSKWCPRPRARRVRHSAPWALTSWDLL